jgi:Fe-S cluster assembly ATPase SufC
VDDKTIVIFRVFTTKPRDVIALFPELWESRGMITSYQHIGQHGAADYAKVIDMSRPAREGEYEDLLAELMERGYDLIIRQRHPKRRG